MRSAASIRGLAVVGVATLATVVVGCGTPRESAVAGQATEAARPAPARRDHPARGRYAPPGDGRRWPGARGLRAAAPQPGTAARDRREAGDARRGRRRAGHAGGRRHPGAAECLRHGLSATFDAGRSGTVVLDVTAERPAAVPERLVHRITVSVEESPGVPFDNSAGALALTFETGPTEVLDEKPVVIAPPAAAVRTWWDGVGCCATRSSHRGAILAISGAFHVAERYAIDFVQLDEQGRLFSGPPEQAVRLRVPRHADPCRGRRHGRQPARWPARAGARCAARGDHRGDRRRQLHRAGHRQRELRLLRPHATGKPALRDGGHDPPGSGRRPPWATRATAMRPTSTSMSWTVRIRWRPTASRTSSPGSRVRGS